MKPLITTAEALALLEQVDKRGQSVPCEIVVVTADEKRKTGGEIITYRQAVWHRSGETNPTSQRAQFPSAPGEPDSPDTTHRKPRGWNRRIRLLTSGQIRQIHAHLILSINGHPVR